MTAACVSPGARRHSINVALYTMLMSKWMGFTEKQMKTVIQAGLLHDIGKIKIPGKILNKKGRLTQEEFYIMKKHTIYGYDILKNSCRLKDSVKKSVLLHHERIDGSGYPFGLKDGSIDMYSRILAVADVYDAMTTDRIYKKRITPFEAFRELRETCLSTFDLTILQRFVNNLSAYYIGARVMLNNGQTGEIKYIPPHDIINPIVSVDSNLLDLSRKDDLKIISII
jgi:putative nucleotidyltransferase with HDIG domain